MTCIDYIITAAAVYIIITAVSLVIECIGLLCMKDTSDTQSSPDFIIYNT